MPLLETVPNIDSVQTGKIFVKCTNNPSEPSLIYSGTKQDIQPLEFRRVILSWHDPSISGLRQICDMFRMISPEAYNKFLEPRKEAALDALHHNFDTALGGFRDTDTRGLRGSFPPSIDATENAISLAKHLAGIPDSQPLGYANAVDLFGKKQTAQITQFIRNSQDTRSGGFYHYPEGAGYSNSRPSLWNTKRALSVLRSLEQGDQEMVSATRFVLACSVTTDTGIGFKESTLGFNDTSSGATTSALNILEMAGETPWIKKHQSELTGFLKLCWRTTKRRGGFSYLPQPRKGDPSLYDTNIVLSSLNALGIDIYSLLPEQNLQELIQLYSWQCKPAQKQKKVLFGFIPYCAPNSYIMRDTMYTLKPLAQKHPEFQALWESIYGNTEKVIRGINTFVTAESIT